MQLVDYINEKFSQADAKILINMRRGGDNNKKGESFETYYAVAKVCDIAANNQQLLNDFTISTQVMGFVDDLCVRQVSTSSKENYQAKNSSGAAASWNKELEKRFRMQIQIDREFYKCAKSRQILLVSCKSKASENAAKIPDDLKDNCVSEHFPYNPKATMVLYQSAELRKNLEKICDTNDLSKLDAAFRCVVAAWICSDGERSVNDIIGEAKRISKPNLFSNLIPEQPSLPDWLHRVCMAFQDLRPRVESGKVLVSYNGFEVNLGESPIEPDPMTLEGFSEISEVLFFLMTEVQKELGNA